ncbi:hypothetical protein S23_62740 [Bradyrhizobium cosmicum]|uniref:Uncharacterized protein n=1 Tax=Bradyrhizobium cosmicum TaxID=1404864 RepID=A0AAI8QEI3_9BRAD|nr:hypothetical protein S23_62740 [Bradyrhizobium cosmicum]
MKMNDVRYPQTPRKARQKRLSNSASIGGHVDMQYVDIASLFGDPETGQGPAENERRHDPRTGTARNQSGNSGVR